MPATINNKDGLEGIAGNDIIIGFAGDDQIVGARYKDNIDEGVSPDMVRTGTNNQRFYMGMGSMPKNQRRHSPVFINSKKLKETDNDFKNR